MDRRNFVGHCAAAAVGIAGGDGMLRLATARGAASATGATPKPSRRLTRIGLELYSVRDAMRRDPERTLAAVAAMGYTEVELLWSFGNFGRTPQQVRDALANTGLRARSAHVTSSAILVGWERSLDLAVANVLAIRDGQPLAHPVLSTQLVRAPNPGRTVPFAVQIASHNTGNGGFVCNVECPAAAESAAAEPPEPVPALLSARWAQSKAPVGATVELAAMCLDLAGQAASFEIRPVDGGAAVATVSGTCGDAVASATWTTPKDTRIAQYTFTVTAGGQSAEGDVLTLVKPFAATLMLDELPAFGVEVELETVETGDRVRATADADGKVAIAEAAIGTWKLHLISAEDA